MDQTRPNQTLPAGAIWGSMLGCCLWAFLLTGLFLVQGHARLALVIGVPCILAGVGVGALTVLVAQLALRVHGRDAQWARLFFGTLSFQMGLLLLLGTEWIVPAIESAGLLDRAGGIQALGVSPWLSGAALLAGVVSLCLALREECRRDGG